MATEWAVEHPSGVRYRVRIGRSDVARFNPAGGLPNLMTWLTGSFRRALRRRVGWTVDVVPLSPWRVFYDPVLSEEHASRTEAERRADAVVNAIADGTLDWDGPWAPPSRP